jgi:hypothetical protein
VYTQFGTTIPSPSYCVKVRAVFLQVISPKEAHIARQIMHSESSRNTYNITVTPCTRGTIRFSLAPAYTGPLVHLAFFPSHLTCSPFLDHSGHSRPPQQVYVSADGRCKRNNSVYVVSRSHWAAGTSCIFPSHLTCSRFLDHRGHS